MVKKRFQAGNSGRGQTARDIMVTRLHTVRPDDRVYLAIQVLLKFSISGAPVVDEQHRLVGILSEKDGIRALIRAVHERMPPARVRDVMSTELITVTEDAHLMHIAEIFLHHPVRRLPVVSASGILIGQISRRDLLAAVSQIFGKASTRESAIISLLSQEASEQQ